MNVFELQASIGLDTGEYESAIKRARKLMEDFEKVATRVATSYDASADKMGDSTKDASNEIARSQKKVENSSEDMGRAVDKAADKISDAMDDATESQRKTGNESEKSSRKVKNNWEDVSGRMNRIGQNFVKMGNLAAKGFAVAAGAIAAVGGALLSIESNTEEYRIAQGKLNTAFKVAGQTTKTANKVFRDFYKILGDTDTAVEASQLLAKLSLNQEDYANWTKIAAGVNGTFGDSLPIEGLIESANETARVGQVTGVLADALNWASINEDDFNEALKNCGSEAERNQLIMETLAEEYDSAADAFYRNNESIMTNRDAQIKATDAMSQVGEAVANLKGDLLEKFLPAIETASEKTADFINSLDADKIYDFASSITDFFSDVSQVLDKSGTGANDWKVIWNATMYDTKKGLEEGKTGLGAFWGALMKTSDEALVYAESMRTAGSPLWEDWPDDAQLARVAMQMLGEDFKNASSDIENTKPVIDGATESVKNFNSETANTQSGFDTSISGMSETAQNFANTLSESLLQSANGFTDLDSNASQTWSDMIVSMGEQWATFTAGMGTNWQQFSESITASDMWSSFASNMSSLVDNARTSMNEVVAAVEDMVAKCKAAMNFSWSLPYLAMPHISISGGFSIDPPSAPSFSVSWYRKAMNNAMILNGATIFGAMNGQLLGGGEAGKEVVSGADTLMNMIRDAVRDVIHSGKNTSGIQIIQNIQTVPQTPVELAALTQSYFEQARWAI